MKNYNRLCLQQRYTIDRILLQGKSQTEIASIIGVHKSTVRRALKRNTRKRGKYASIYSSLRSKQKADKREKKSENA